MKSHLRVAAGGPAVPDLPIPDGRPEVFDRLRRLHSPAVVCRGCCAVACGGDCEWSDEYAGELLTVCTHCCIDAVEGKQNWVCLDDHRHGSEAEPAAICATVAILDDDDADAPA